MSHEEKKEYSSLEIEPSKLAVNDTNCHLGRPFRDKITIKDGKLFKKNKENKYFKWVLKKNYNNIDNFIDSLKNIPLPPNVIQYLNNKIDNEIEDNKTRDEKVISDDLARMGVQQDEGQDHLAVLGLLVIASQQISDGPDE